MLKDFTFVSENKIVLMKLKYILKYILLFLCLWHSSKIFLI